jgi:hypothetical protein
LERRHSWQAAMRHAISRNYTTFIAAITPPISRVHRKHQVTCRQRDTVQSERRPLRVQVDLAETFLAASAVTAPAAPSRFKRLSLIFILTGSKMIMQIQEEFFLHCMCTFFF